jgi:hypothetical protein
MAQLLRHRLPRADALMGEAATDASIIPRRMNLTAYGLV